MPKGIYPRRKSAKKVVPKRKYTKRAPSFDDAPNYGAPETDSEPVRFKCESCAEKEQFQNQQAEALRLAYDKIARYENQEAAVKEWNKEREEEIIVLEIENRLFQRFMFILENLNKR